MSLTNPNSVVTEQRLSEFYAGIRPYLGGMPDILANKFNRSDLYSTDEQLIGRWIDGKPLYQKTIDCGALPNSTSKSIAHNISNVDKIINAVGYGASSSGVSLFIGDVSTNSDRSGDIGLIANKTNIEICTYRDRSSYTESYVTLRYTKTTDSAVAIGSDTDYSTTEKIVGTWIDGKPLYQKTFDISISTGWTVVDHQISNVDKIFLHEGYVYNTNNYSRNIGGAASQTQLFGAITPATINVYNTDSAYGKAMITLRYTKTS